MPSILRTYSSAQSNASSSHNSKSRQSSVLDAVSFSSQSTAPTSVASPGSPLLIDGKPPSYNEADRSPSTHCYPCSSSEISMSVSAPQDLEQDLYDDDDENSSIDDDDDDDDDDNDDDGDDTGPYSGLSHGHERHSAYDEAIPRLPEYRHDIVDDTVRPSSPEEFAQLFPSLNRMAIRHDEFTTDGNMNLRVDITLPGSSSGRRRRPTTYQLFHLRMYDLAKREFSLRRYCRDSGREVCSAKRLYHDPAAKHSTPVLGRSRRSSHGSGSHGMPPALQRSMSMALRSLSAVVMKSRSSASRPATSHSPYGSDGDAMSAASSHSAALSSRSMPSLFGRATTKEGRALALPPPPKPTNTIKLEFSNYARVDVERRGSPGSHHSSGSGSGSGSSDNSNVRYSFEWWGHTYTWKRIAEKHLDVVSYHLLRDGGDSTPVAHIVPEMRSLNEVHADDAAGGWIPPCHLWLTDPSVLDAKTDVSDVIVATGLMALVDDCIRMRWAPRRAEQQHHHFWAAAPLALQDVFHRRHGGAHASSPLRHAQPISTY